MVMHAAPETDDVGPGMTSSHGLIDSHCHLDAAAFDVDRDAVLVRAQSAGVRQVIVPATHRAAWPKLESLCAAHDGLHAAIGLHPMFLAKHTSGDAAYLAERLQVAKPVAIGECGLDFHVEGLNREEQTRCFDAQLHLARVHDLPVIVHARRAVDAVIGALRRFDGIRGVVHSFSGSPEQARQLWQLGILVGIGGPVTFERAKRLHRLVAELPAEQLVLETDAPDQPGRAHRGERNEPAHLVHVLEAVAALRGEAAAMVAAQTSRNASRLFGIPGT